MAGPHRPGEKGTWVSNCVLSGSPWINLTLMGDLVVLFLHVPGTSEASIYADPSWVESSGCL